MMDLDEFVALVEEMRGIQKDYFRIRAPSILAKAKAAERKVDDWIDAYHGKKKPEQASLME